MREAASGCALQARHAQACVRLMIGMGLRQQMPALPMNEDPGGSEEQDHNNNGRCDDGEEVRIF